MLINRCAGNKSGIVRHLWYSIIFIWLYLICFFPLYSVATEAVIVKIILNQEIKGEFFVHMTDDKDFLVKIEDLKSMGFSEPKGKITQIAGELFLSLRSIEGMEFQFDEKELALEIMAKPDLLSLKSVDLMPKRQPKVYYPKDSGFFLNYSIDHNSSDSFEFQSFNVTNEVGIRLRDYLFLSNFAYHDSKEQETFVRLMSNITYDNRSNLQRFLAGDFYALSGDLGSSLNLGGLSFSKIYKIDPYFINRPLFNFTGLATLPSEVEVYIDGTRIMTEKFSPGQFSLKNLNYYGGARFIEVVVKDAFGRETRYRLPFYFNDILLSKGLHEYSYNIGFIREQFGVRSNDYRNLAFSGFHKYGVSDSFNIGFSAEAKRGTYVIGPQAALLLGRAGTLVLVFSGSHDEDKGGGNAGLLNYGYQGTLFNWRLLLKKYSRSYMTVVSDASTAGTKHEIGAGIGYGTASFGSLSVDYTETKKYEERSTKTYAVTYSRNITQKSTLFSSYKHIREHNNSDEFFIGLTYYFGGRDTTLSISHQQDREKNTQITQLTKNVPVGEGYGYRLYGDRTESHGTVSNTVNPYFQYNAKYGIYTGEYKGTYTNGQNIEAYRFTAAGSIAYTGNTLGFSRPINDSFGVVQTSDLKGVRVYINNEEIGKTNASGKVFVPNLNSYLDNQISINEKDIPMNYTMTEVIKYVSPPLRSGSYIKFDVTKFYAITGMLHVKVNGEAKPAEFFEVTTKVDDKELTFPTGRGGEFYLENIKPGKYSASFDYKDKKCFFELAIPKSDDVIIDLGVITCKDFY